MKNNDDRRDRNVTTLTESRGGGQSRPRTPSGQRNRWQPPRNSSTASSRQSETRQSSGEAAWYTPYAAAEQAKFGHWELAVQPTEDGNSWEWTATIPDWEDDDGKQHQGASFKGRSPTKDGAKEEAKQKASSTLLG